MALWCFIMVASIPALVKSNYPARSDPQAPAGISAAIMSRFCTRLQFVMQPGAKRKQFVIIHAVFTFPLLTKFYSWPTFTVAFRDASPFVSCFAPGCKYTVFTQRLSSQQDTVMKKPDCC
ncbi:hypothetical protein M8494_10710 [Serratia ureilytica]